MNELEMQKLVVDDTCDNGGFAQKLSNQFIRGIADLLVKRPAYPAGVLEVKQRTKPKSMDLVFELDVTFLQKKHLRECWDAGMPAGVISFLETPRKGAAGLYMEICTFREIEDKQYRVHASAHELLSSPKNLAPWNIGEHLDDFFRRCAQQQGWHQTNAGKRSK